MRSWNSVLKDESINAIALATPASEHTRMPLECLNARKHVFVKEPLALSMKDSKCVAEIAKRSNLVVLVDHLFQYHPAFIALKALVRNGSLGRVQHINSRRLCFGRVRAKEDVVWSLARHDLSMILALANEEPNGITPKGFHHLRLGIADTATVGLSFASGLEAHVHVSWLYPE